MSYLNLEVQEYKESTNIKIIEEFEQLIQAKLPDSYKRFLLKYNGGRPVSKSSFTYIEYINKVKNISSSGIDWFLALYNGKHNNIIEYNLYTYKDRIPYEFCAIASAYGSNLICLCVEEPNYGKVYYWDHDWEADDNDDIKPHYDNVYLIANSFEEFINSLYECVDEDDNGIDQSLTNDIPKKLS